MPRCLHSQQPARPAMRHRDGIAVLRHCGGHFVRQHQDTVEKKDSYSSEVKHCRVHNSQKEKRLVVNNQPFSQRNKRCPALASLGKQRGTVSRPTKRTRGSPTQICTLSLQSIRSSVRPRCLLQHETHLRSCKIFCLPTRRAGEATRWVA